MPLRNIFFIILSTIVSLACYNVATKNRYANLFAEALDLIENEALEEIPREKLFDSAMLGMMTELDEHSTFISGERFRAFDEDMRQQFGGVGMYVDNDPKNERLVVLAPIPGTPAFKAGIQIGDEILEIDGVPTEGVKRADAIKQMRGPRGEAVQLKIQRGDKILEMSLVRASIPLPSVHGDWRNPDGTWNYVLKDMPNVGYIRLLQFGDRTTGEVAGALQQIKSKVDGVIIDLRNNSGGLLVSAIDICDMFIEPELPIVRTRGRGGVVLREHSSKNDMLLNPGIPMVILVNRNSASASEIVAACLQDHSRAVLIGEQSWGKGTVQNVIPMQRGESALKLTTASYWRPSDVNIDRNDPAAKVTGKWGVQPNDGMAVEMSEDEIFANMRERSRRDLMGLRRDNDLPDDDQPEEAVPAEDVIDGPLEKAKQHFKKLLTRAAAA